MLMMMYVWLHKLGGLVGLSEPVDDGVREVLREAADRSLTVMLEPLGGSDDGTDLEAVLESVEDRALVLRLAPSVTNRRLEQGEHIRISIQGETAVEEGDVEVIAPWTSSGRSGKQRGYRVTIPSSLVEVQRRGSQRISVAFDLSPKIEIRDPDSGDFLADGQILDLSETGLRVFIPTGMPLLRRQTILIKAEFPAPFASFKGNCEVVRAGPAKSGQGQVVGLKLLQAVDALSETIEKLRDLREARRHRHHRGTGAS
jgi:c-di-GMP-binding flagellar brake protein YcgR